MKRTPWARLWPILAALVAFLAGSSAVYAHERRAVGPYEFVVGFIVEPAFEGQKNGVDLRVQIPAAAEGEEPTPVEGVEQTLQVEITHVPTGISTVMDLRTIFNDPGHYTADLLPTAPGVYRFRIFGTVEELAVDETFESGENTFGSVESSAAIQFPESVPQVREVEGAVRGAQDAAGQALAAARQAESAAAAARSLAVAGVAVGAFGFLMGAAAAVVAFRRR